MFVIQVGIILHGYIYCLCTLNICIKRFKVRESHRHSDPQIIYGFWFYASCDSKTLTVQFPFTNQKIVLFPEYVSSINFIFVYIL